MRLCYDAVARNRGPILEVIEGRLPASGTVLEIASGSGEHVVWFAAARPDLHWQPSDPDVRARASITAWIEHGKLANVAPPLAIDATTWPWPVQQADAIVCINMIHISPWEATEGLLAAAGRLLPPGGPLLLYGPYIVDGETAPSNRAFDESLRRRDPSWGVRELRDVERAAAGHGLRLVEHVAMPANNFTVELRREHPR